MSQLNPSSVVVKTGEDRIALLLGRAQIRAEMLQARVETLEAQLAATTPPPKPAKTKRPAK